ncbi:MAG: hypothetical protein ABJ327_18110 [Litoreibacter sp.]
MVTGSNRFFTPPKIPKVDLRVTSLSGGGACPSQFEGLTPDGRAVYIRYRGGVLSIEVANASSEDAHSGVKILNIELGPPLDGTISAQQIVSLTGLVVDELDESRLSQSEVERDLSGTKTFFSANEISATNEGAMKFLSLLWSEFPDCRVTEITWSQQERRNERLLDVDEVPKETLLQIQLGNKCPAISLQFSRFKYDFPGHGRPDGDVRFSEEVKRKIETVGSFGCAVKYGSLSISSEFCTNNTAARDWLEKLDSVLGDCFPETEYSSYDLGSGEEIGSESWKVQDDRAISEWVAAASNRFRFVRRQARGSSLIGYR